MKNILGKIIGFIAGLVGFLLLFKVFILDNTSPSDELAPGIVVLMAIFNGVVFAFVGSWVQGYFKKRTV